MSLGRWFVIRLIFNPGHDVKCPCFMDLMIVNGVGLKSAPDIYCARYLFFYPAGLYHLPCFLGRWRWELEEGEGLMGIGHNPMPLHFPVMMTFVVFNYMEMMFRKQY